MRFGSELAGGGGWGIHGTRAGAGRPWEPDLKDMAFGQGLLSLCAWTLCSAQVVLPLRSVLPSGAQLPCGSGTAGGMQAQPPLHMTPASSGVTQLGRYMPRNQKD